MFNFLGAEQTEPIKREKREKKKSYSIVYQTTGHFFLTYYLDTSAQAG